MSKISNINWEIPSHIFEIIFSKLAIVNLPNCRLVCKAWNDLILTCKFLPISSFSFAHIFPYDNLHCVDLDPKHWKDTKVVASFTFHPRFSNFKIIGSFNGLLCLSTSHTRHVHILNPMTNESIELPPFAPHLLNIRFITKYIYGFGFNPKSKQYKIVRISMPFNTIVEEVEIFAFGPSSNKWRSVPFSLRLEINDDGVYLNGALFWIGCYNVELESKNVLVCFDVEEERFKEISFPQAGRDGKRNYLAIRDFDSHLYLSIFEMECFGYHVWKMEEGDLWIKKFVIAMPISRYIDLYWRPYDVQIIEALEDGKMLCLISRMNLILYDPKTARTKVLFELSNEIREELWIYQIQSFNFGPLSKILAGAI